MPPRMTPEQAQKVLRRILKPAASKDTAYLTRGIGENGRPFFMLILKTRIELSRQEYELIEKELDESE